MPALLVPAGGSLDVVVPAASAIAVDCSGGGFQVLQLIAGAPHQPPQLVLLAESPAGSVVPYVSSNFTNATTVRVQATGNVDCFYEVGTAPIVKYFKGEIKQSAPVAVNASATLTVAQLLTGIITSTTAAAVTATLPTAAALDAATSFATTAAYEFDVINTGAANAFTIATATGWTLVGNMVVALSSSGKFRIHKTAAGAFSLYRLG
jgi:hypothetical protein